MGIRRAFTYYVQAGIPKRIHMWMLGRMMCSMLKIAMAGGCKAVWRHWNCLGGVRLGFSTPVWRHISGLPLLHSSSNSISMLQH